MIPRSWHFQLSPHVGFGVTTDISNITPEQSMHLLKALSICWDGTPAPVSAITPADLTNLQRKYM